MGQQLLIEMPAEGAARLLTLSLLEHLMQHAPAPAPPDHSANGAAADSKASVVTSPGPSAEYQSVLGRLRACMTLYAVALGDDVPRKARRHLRILSAAVQRVRQADAQRAWLARFIRESADRPDGPAVASSDGVAAAKWLYERIGRRRERADCAFERARAGARPLRRLAKRLGVYTTEVRIDDMPAHRSFAALTGAALVDSASGLAEAVSSLQSGYDPRGARRARRSVTCLTYLLEPVRAYVDVGTPANDALELSVALQRLEELMLVGRAVIRGGRRIGAMHSAELLRMTLVPSRRPPPGIDVSLDDAPPITHLGMVQRGLLVIAHRLREESSTAFDALAATWLDTRAPQLVDDLTRIGTRLDPG